MESSSSGFSNSAGREVLRRVRWEQEMQLIAQFLLGLCLKKKGGSSFCIPPILAKNS